jgi:elongation factor G
MLSKFLDGEVPTIDKLFVALTRAVTAGLLVPIFCVSARKDIGLSDLLDDLADFAPSPASGLGRTATKSDSEIHLSADPSRPVVARAFKAHADKFGNLTYLRIFQGSMHSNATLKDDREGAAHRLGQLHHPQGKSLDKIEEAGPGEFVVVAKVDGVNIGDTLSDDGAFSMPPIRFPRPMFPLAVAAKNRADDAKLLQILRKVSHEDPCFQIHRDEQTGETVMSGLSQLHLEVVQHRLKARDHLELDSHEPKIPYKETIAKPGESMYRHKKQTGGRGQFAEVHLRLHPRERGSGFEFINSIVGGAIPGQYIPAVEKGIRETLAHGVVAGCEVVDLAAEVHFGKFHDVDSSEAAFKYAAAMAFKEAFAQCSPLLLEPIVNMEITVPGEKMGDVNGDLNSRRAQIVGMDVLPGGMQVVKAKVPLAEVLRYQTELKSMTGGQGAFSMDFSHLAPIPPNVQHQVVEKYKAAKVEKVEH